MKKIGMILSGCGVMDATEIHEAVSLMIALDKRGVEIVFMAPDRPQMHVINHLTNEVMEGEGRNILIESARIARGNIRSISEVNVDELDGLAIPGGYGAAKNLSDFAVSGNEMRVMEEVEGLIRGMVDRGKPVIAVCIAPAIIARLFGDRNVKFTIGNDESTAEVLSSFGGTHVCTTAKYFAFDENLKIVTAPAYMLASGPAELFDGIDKAVEKFMELL